MARSTDLFLIPPSPRTDLFLSLVRGEFCAFCACYFLRSEFLCVVLDYASYFVRSRNRLISFSLGGELFVSLRAFVRSLFGETLLSLSPVARCVRPVDLFILPR